MRTIRKYRMDSPKQTFDIPNGSQVRFVAIQDGWVNLWIDVDTEYRLVKRTFQAFATGVELPGWDTSTYLGTVHVNEGGQDFVWHVFELWQKPEGV